MNKKFLMIVCLLVIIPVEAYIGRFNTGSLPNGMRRVAQLAKTRFLAKKGKNLAASLVSKSVPEKVMTHVTKQGVAPVGQIASTVSSTPAVIPYLPQETMRALATKSTFFPGFKDGVLTELKSMPMLYNPTASSLVQMPQEQLQALAAKVAFYPGYLNPLEASKKAAEEFAKNTTVRQKIAAHIGKIYATTCATVGGAVTQMAGRANDLLVKLHAPESVSAQVDQVSTPSVAFGASLPTDASSVISTALPAVVTGEVAPAVTGGVVDTVIGAASQTLSDGASCAAASVVAPAALPVPTGTAVTGVASTASRLTSTVLPTATEGITTVTSGVTDTVNAAASQTLPGSITDMLTNGASSASGNATEAVVVPMFTAIQKEWLISSGIVAACAATIYCTHYKINPFKKVRDLFRKEPVRV